MPTVKRRRRVSRTLERGPVAIAMAIPKDRRRVRRVREFLEGVARYCARVKRSDGARTLLAFAKLLVSYSDKSYTTLVSWQKLASELVTNRGRGDGSRRANPRTIAKHLAELRAAGLLATVAGGRRGCFAKGGHASRTKMSWRDVPERNADGDPSNEVPIYVLCVPLTPEENDARKTEEVAHRAQVSAGSASPVDEMGTPPPWVSSSPPVRARDAAGHDLAVPLRGPHHSRAAQARRDDPVLRRRPGGWWETSVTPGGQDAALKASHELRVRLPILQRISSKHVRSVLRPFFDAGWTVGDVLIAIDVRPGNGRWSHDGAHGVGNVGAWLAYRLQPWTNEGAPRRSPSQRLAQRRSEDQARRRVDAERTAAIQPASSPAVREYMAEIRRSLHR